MINTPTPFAALTPDVVLDAVEQAGFVVDSRLMALNSYENRVYRVGVEAGTLENISQGAVADAVVVKFYRAARWSDAAILEEHQFAQELAEAELALPVPIRVDGQTLLKIATHRFAVFECWRGGQPELDMPGHREMLGRSLGRLHAVGERARFRQRGSLASWRFGAVAREQILALGVISPELSERYAEVSAQLVMAIENAFEQVGPTRQIRLHGDCHAGNLLWNTNGPVFVDLDDCLTGPAAQDLWMLCAGDGSQQRRDWEQLLAGYEQFAHLDYAELHLFEALRGMRMLNHSAWIATRWSDPAFPRAFPWFAEVRHWEQHIQQLQEQIEAVEDPPLLQGS
jgi:Ser/Thr protein kinase RdoA (MazF antagonist)